MKNYFSKIIASLFYIFASILPLSIGYFAYSLFGISMAVISSFFILIGLIMFIRLIQLWKYEKAFKRPMPMLKNWWRFLLLTIIVIPITLDAIFDVMGYFVFENLETETDFIAGVATFALIGCYLISLLLKGAFNANKVKK